MGCGLGGKIPRCCWKLRLNFSRLNELSWRPLRTRRRKAPSFLIRAGCSQDKMKKLSERSAKAEKESSAFLSSTSQNFGGTPAIKTLKRVGKFYDLASLPLCNNSSSSRENALGVKTMRFFYGPGRNYFTMRRKKRGRRSGRGNNNKRLRKAAITLTVNLKRERGGLH